jgi:hypothetical protein
VRTWSSPRLFFGLLAFLIVLIGLIFGAINWKKKPGIFLGFFWVLVAFGPISQITPVPDPVAERFCYVPFIGVAILAALLIEKLPARKSTNVVLILVLASLGARSTVRALDWQDDRTLNIANWQDSPRPTEKSTRSLSALYLMLPPEYVSIRIAGADALAKAGEQLDLLARLAPDDPEGWRLRAIWHLRSGDVADAKAAYDRAKYLGLSFADTDPLHQKFETLRSDEN